ncbi:MAG TPA: hypothetical protein VGI58_18455 [Streptosporangiaceae bacterium]
MENAALAGEIVIERTVGTVFSDNWRLAAVPGPGPAAAVPQPASASTAHASSKRALRNARVRDNRVRDGWSRGDRHGEAWLTGGRRCHVTMIRIAFLLPG